MAGQPNNPARKAFRARTDAEAEALFAHLKSIADDAEKTTHAHLKCPRCEKYSHYHVPIPDQNQRVRAMEVILMHGWGRPGAVEPERDLAGLAERDPTELTADERRMLLSEVRMRLDRKEAVNGSEEEASWVPGGAEEDRG